jgi:hypothetical protein
MAKTAGMGDAYYIDGTDVSGDTQALGSLHGGPAAIDVTAINNSAYARLGGERDASIDWVSYFNPGAGLTHAKLSALPTADVICTYFQGTAIGNAAASMIGKQINYDPSRGQDGSLTFAVQAQADGFGLEWGQQLTPGRRVDGAAVAASSSNSFDTLASAAFGAQAYFHLFAFTGTSVTISVWDSADNVTFLAVASLTTTALTTPGAVRVAIASNATVRRYIAVATVGTFSSADFAVSVVKNQIAGQVF